jgi:hypothetical protein
MLVPVIGQQVDALAGPLASSLPMRPEAAHPQAVVALVARRHVDLCRQSSAICR